MAFNPLSNQSTGLIYRLGGDQYRDFIHIFLCWKKVVGDLLASHSHPIRYQHKMLYVAVENNTWMQELVLLKQDILRNYKQNFQEEIAEMVFLISSPKRKCTKRK